MTGASLHRFVLFVTHPSVSWLLYASQFTRNGRELLSNDSQGLQSNGFSDS